jgi:gamma-glutamyl-gamma-aminobutyrate hydrolase PuuD
MKVLIIDGDQNYTAMYENRGHEVVSEMDDADLIQFTGGADVSPSYYGSLTHPRTVYDIRRDVKEKDLYMMNRVHFQIPMTGICRGGQFLNVMNGGQMYQHVDNHAIGGTHNTLDLRTGETIPVSSTHHQMMKPLLHPTNCEVIGGNLVPLSTFKQTVDVHGDIEEVQEGADIEVVHYPNTKSLCFQPHPEYMNEDHPCQVWYFNLLEELLGVK